MEEEDIITFTKPEPQEKDPWEDRDCTPLETAIEKVLRTLTPLEEKAFKMRYMENKSPTQIAEWMGVSITTAYRKLRKAKTKLRHPSRLRMLPSIPRDMKHIVALYIILGRRRINESLEGKGNHPSQ